MGRKPCCNKDVVRRGAWTTEEDKLLRDYIASHGEGKWRSLPLNAGLNRCGKSCRLRWFNYLKPDIKRGNITLEEEDLIIKLHEQFGNRWVLIAEGLPGRTDNEIKNYWNTTLKRKILKNGSKLEVPKRTKFNIVTPPADPCTDPISEQNTSSSSNIWESLLLELELESEEEVQLPLPKLESETNVDEKCMEETSSTTNINDESFASSSNMSKESFDWNFDQGWDNEVNMSHFMSEYDNDHDWENWLESFDVRSFSSFLDEDLWSSVYV